MTHLSRIWHSVEPTAMPTWYIWLLYLIAVSVIIGAVICA